MLVVVLIIMIAVLVALAALVTAAIAVVLKRRPTSSTAPGRNVVIVGMILPMLMAAYGLYLLWPWPWYRPEAMQDGIPPGSLLLMASLPSVLVCFAVSRFVLAQREG